MRVSDDENTWHVCFGDGVHHDDDVVSKLLEKGIEYVLE